MFEESYNHNQRFYEHFNPRFHTYLFIICKHHYGTQERSQKICLRKLAKNYEIYFDLFFPF